jgi:hypothetical protein
MIAQSLLPTEGNSTVVHVAVTAGAWQGEGPAKACKAGSKALIHWSKDYTGECGFPKAWQDGVLRSSTCLQVHRYRIWPRVG